MNQGDEAGSSDVGTTRVVIVDDDPLVRTGLRLILGGESRIAVVAEAANGEEALTVVARERPDVVLMDIRMPVRDGLSATEALKATPNPPRVIVLTTFDADDSVVRALRLGADGFLLKDTPPARLVAAVLDVARGNPALSPTVTATLMATFAGSSAASAVDDRALRARASLSRLTDREQEVATAIARGLSNAEIGQELFMGVSTVKTHVGRLLSKLEVDNRVQIALLVHDATS